MLKAQQNAPKPENKALSYIEQQALQGADLLKSRDYRDLGKNGNVFFDFQLPAEQAKQREMYANANQTGTFAMSDNAGAGAATSLQSQFLKDRAGRDSSQGFQDNIQRAAGNIHGGLATAASGVAGANDAETQRQMAILNSFTDLYKFKKQANAAGGIGMLSSILGGAASVGSAALGAWGAKK